MPSLPNAHPNGPTGSRSSTRPSSPTCSTSSASARSACTRASARCGRRRRWPGSRSPCRPSRPARSPPRTPTRANWPRSIRSQTGDVLVVSESAWSFWGELLSTAANYRGCRGVVLDGPTRDSPAIREMGFPVFHVGFHPRRQPRPARRGRAQRAHRVRRRAGLSRRPDPGRPRRRRGRAAAPPRRRRCGSPRRR